MCEKAIATFEILQNICKHSEAHCNIYNCLKIFQNIFVLRKIIQKICREFCKYPKLSVGSFETCEKYVKVF